MTRVFVTYLWKEWRGQRPALGWLAAVLVSLAVLAAFLLPRDKAVAEALFESWGFLALLVFLFTVGPDFLAGERNDGRLRFLERVPGGLRTAFAAKLAFFAVSGAAVLLFGFLLGAVLLAVHRGSGTWSELLDLEDTVVLWIPIAAVATWTFTTAAWVPRGAFGLPAAVLVLALLGWPLWLCYGGSAAPLENEGRLYVWLSLLGAPIAGWCSFTVGSRYGRGRGRAAACGIVAMLIMIAPAWGWTGRRVQRMLTVDPRSEHFQVITGLVGDTGRYAYLTIDCPTPHFLRRGDTMWRGLVVDLETGTWRSEGIGGWFRSNAGLYVIKPWTSEPVAQAWLRWEGEDGQQCFDARSSQPFQVAPVPPALAALPPEVRNGLVTEGGRWRRAGLGYCVLRSKKDGGHSYFDPFRGCYFPSRELFPEGERPGFYDVMVRSGKWLVLQGHRLGERFALDPETGERTPLWWLTEDMYVGPLLRDGALLVLDAGECYRLDPDSGDRQQVTLAGERVGRFHGISPGLGGLIDTTGLLTLYGEQGLTVARFDASTLTVRLAARRGTNYPTVIGILDDDTAIAIEEQRRLVRLHFDGRPPEVLFPRPLE